MKSYVLSKIRVSIYLIIFSLFSINGKAQYCVPATTFGCVFGDYPVQFSMTGTSSSINDPTLTCTGAAGYEDRTTETCTVVSPSVVNCTITSNSSSSTGYTTTSLGGTSPTSTNYSVELYVDWDNNGDFYGTNEDIGGASFLMATPTPFTVNIPSGLTSGTYTMRMAFSSAGSPPDPCMVIALPFPFPSLNYPTGNVIDYKITVGPSCPAPTVSLGAATCSTQVINWTAATGATGYEYIVNTTATSPTTAGTATTALTTTATSLSSGTAYYAHVRTNCGGGSYSPWVNTPFTTTGPGAITGTAATCPGNTTQLSNSVAGGTWSSSNTTVATVTSGGLVGGGSTGSTVISYNQGGCTATLVVNVGNLPGITGTTSICPGGTTTLANSVPGGTWSSSNVPIASVNPSTGLVTGGTSAGTAVITYSANGCIATTTVTVSTLPAISGGNTVCVGSTLSLSNSVSGGSWTSSAAGTASVNASGVVSGVAAGTATITYSLGSCYVTKTVTVGAAISPITGTTTFCVTSSTTLADATPGGTWSSSNTGVANVSGTGVVSGVSAGTATISYNAGSCATTVVVTVEPNNAGTISGPDTVCKGPAHSATLTSTVPGGTWSSSAPTKGTVDPATGVVTGLTANSTFTITYTVTNTCGTFTATKNIRVRSATTAPCTTGIDPGGEPDALELDVFPNPNGGLFTVNIITELNEKAHVEIYNIVGSKVKEFNTVTNKKTDVHLNVPPGVYTMSATTDHGRYVRKIVVEK